MIILTGGSGADFVQDVSCLSQCFYIHLGHENEPYKPCYHRVPVLGLGHKHNSKVQIGETVLFLFFPTNPPPPIAV